MVDRSQQREGAHPTAATYVKIAFILSFLTAIEFLVFYADVPNLVLIAIFLLLSLVKFTLVILFYMHLKFDNPLFSVMFVGGLALAVTVSIALMAIFQTLSTFANPSEGDGEVHISTEVAPTPTPPIDNGGVDCASDDQVCQGRQLFLNVPASAAPQALWCSQCHTVGELSSGLIGPELTNIGSEAGSRKPGTSTEEYIRESISSPEAFLCDVPRCTAGLMTEAVTQGLTGNEIDGLVAFLLNPVEQGVAPPSDTTDQAPSQQTREPSVDSPPPGGSPVALGEELFLTPPLNVGAQALWCSQCHTIDGIAAGLIGPDLTNIGAEAAQRKPGMSAEAYIVESIRQPDAFIATGIERATAGLMTTAIVQDLTQDQVAALAAFLLAQR